MGVCEDDNYDYYNHRDTTCTSGYDPQTTACCNRGMYVFWNVVMWMAMCLCCGVCIFMMVSRARQARG